MKYGVEKVIFHIILLSHSTRRLGLRLWLYVTQRLQCVATQSHVHVSILRPLSSAFTRLHASTGITFNFGFGRRLNQFFNNNFIIIFVAVWILHSQWRLNCLQANHLSSLKIDSAIRRREKVPTQTFNESARNLLHVSTQLMTKEDKLARGQKKASSSVIYANQKSTQMFHRSTQMLAAKTHKNGF